MTWVMVAVGVWVLCAVVAALLIGRAIRLADRKEAEALERQYAAHLPNVVIDPLHAPDETDAGLPCPANPWAVERLHAPEHAVAEEPFRPAPRTPAAHHRVPSDERTPNSRSRGRS
jgi:hypothetical protein